MARPQEAMRRFQRHLPSRGGIMRSLLLIAALLLALPAGAVNILYVAVRDTGNACDLQPPDCFGAVDHDYAISRYEVTNTQYAEFLNAVATSTDTYGLYSPSMDGHGISYPIVPIGFERLYEVEPGFESKPVVWVSFWDALRFANWLHNGQPQGLQDETTTEDGAYTLTADGVADNTIARNEGAQVFVPSEEEWYKAAYYDAALGAYFDYPTRTDAAPVSELPMGGANSANFYDPTTGFAVTGSPTYVASIDYRTDVGAYASSSSPYGTFDQGGNVWEWNEEIFPGPSRGRRGGSWGNVVFSVSVSGRESKGPGEDSDAIGFRVARTIPEPGEVLLVLTGGVVLAAARRQRRG
jgi:formylglycine-generating enzyme required for sulfatase activity